jgi:peptidoglycan hydrolase-like protein with peptidoglycan-binding domain
LVQHHDLGAAGGGHVDCSAIGSDTWLKLVAYTKEAFDAFGDGPLPAFALHGAPGPHHVEAPPAVAPEPSHGGAARAQPSDTHEHVTPSSYPRYSLAAMQFDLNAAGASPRIVVDGLWGDETRAALIAFQRGHGCAPDGLIGSQTWAKLDEVTGAPSPTK